MHVYRYQYKNYNRSHDKRKKRRRILPVTILIVAAAVILSGGVRLDPGELGFLLQEEIVGFFLPQACGQAQGTAELTIADRLFAHFFLLPEESGVSADYQTQVESDWSYEAILAREAADENYVDAATGEVIMTQEAAEQSSTSMREGETKEQTQGTVPEAAEGQQAEAQTAQAEAQIAARCRAKAPTLEAVAAAAKKTGREFDSRGEYDYYMGMILPKVQRGEIVKVESHRRFTMLPEKEYGNVKLPAMHYTPDFVLTYADGTVEVVEVKSKFTRRQQRDYIHRRRMFIDLVAEPRGWRFVEHITPDTAAEIKAWKKCAQQTERKG